MDRLRVIQWTTGKVGKLSTRGILDDPRLELVGVYAYSDEKSGADAGTLCGRPESGVRATTDIDALIALRADAVIYTPFMADVEHAARLLESGLDVVSTNLFLNVAAFRAKRSNDSRTPVGVAKARCTSPVSTQVGSTR